MEPFFQKSKVELFMTQSIFLTTYHDKLDPTFEKLFLCYFYKELFIILILEPEMKEKILNIEYHTFSLETSS